MGENAEKKTEEKTETEAKTAEYSASMQQAMGTSKFRGLSIRLFKFSRSYCQQQCSHDYALHIHLVKIII